MIRPAALLFTTLLAVPALAAEPACSRFQMDVSTERELFQSPPRTVEAAADAARAGDVQAGQLYEVKLKPQQQVRFVATPERKPDPALTGGMLRIHIAEGGRYRVAVDARSWVDAVYAGQPLATNDFRSDRECAGPTKIVTFDVPSGADLVLQFIDVDRPSLRLAVTAAPRETW